MVEVAQASEVSASSIQGQSESKTMTIEPVLDYTDEEEDADFGTDWSEDFEPEAP